MSVAEKSPVLVLYASQTGSTEAAARNIADTISSRYGRPAECLWLDDFLESGYSADGDTRCMWTEVVVMCVSSYGVGQAPLGGQKFRAVADAVIGGSEEKVDLSAVQYALLGLGDSSYTTFFENPKATDKIMEQCGATRICGVGMGDANSDDPDQIEAIRIWTDDELVPALDKILMGDNEDLNTTRLERARKDTLRVYQSMYPEAHESTANDASKGIFFGLGKIVVAVGVALTAIIMVVMQR